MWSRSRCFVLTAPSCQARLPLGSSSSMNGTLTKAISSAIRQGGFFCCRYKQKESNRNMWGNKGHPRLFQPGFSVAIVSKNMTGVLCWCRRYHLLSLGLCISITQAVMNHSPGTLSLGLMWVSKPGIPSVFCHGAPYKYWGGKSPKSKREDWFQEGRNFQRRLKRKVATSLRQEARICILRFTQSFLWLISLALHFLMSVIPQLPKHAHSTACPWKLSPPAFYKSSLTNKQAAPHFTHIPM